MLRSSIESGLMRALVRRADTRAFPMVVGGVAAALVSAAAACSFYAIWFISVWFFFTRALSVVALLYFIDPCRTSPAGGTTRQLEVL